ncbi:MAG: GC-type dockerin domain-anchored protein, partial [Planctomycetota bacterium]
GLAHADCDRIDINAPAALGGTLDLTLTNGYVPPNAMSFTILTATSLSGIYAVEHLPPHFHLEYFPTGIRAVYCAADFNSDGALDFFDYDEFVVAFEAGSLEADFDADGTVDFFDYDNFVVAFEEGC